MENCWINPSQTLQLNLQNLDDDEWPLEGYLWAVLGLGKAHGRKAEEEDQ